MEHEVSSTAVTENEGERKAPEPVQYPFFIGMLQFWVEKVGDKDLGVQKGRVSLGVVVVSESPA